MADVGGVRVLVDSRTITQVAQRLVCWNRSGTGARQTVRYETGFPKPSFYIPGGTCAGKPALTLKPGGATIACNATGDPVLVDATVDDVVGLNPNSCTEIAAPTGLAVGTPAPTQTVINVLWVKPASYDPTGYVLRHRVKTPAGPWTTVEVPAGTLTASVTGLTAGTDYEFTVAAKQGALVSPATAAVTIATAAA